MSALLEFITPLVSLALGLVSIVAFLLGALANPQGWMNAVVISAIDYVAFLFPSTPDNLKIGSLLSGAISAVGGSIPAVGTGIIKEIFVSILAISVVSLAIKIYKLLPFV